MKSLKTDLAGFTPKPKTEREPRPEPAPTSRAGEGWPSREPEAPPADLLDATLSMRGPSRVLNRFKQMAKADRYSQWAFLEILMDHYDRTNEK